MDLLFESNRLAGELATEFRKMLILEETTSDGKTIVAYSGHFQPFHDGHFRIYKTLVKKFGKDNVYITTTNETDEFENPLSYDDKKNIITKMFGIEESKFQEVENPFIPKELLKQFDPKQTSFVTVVSTDDAAALSKSKYFRHYNDAETLRPYNQAGYYLTIPEIRGEVGNQALTGQQIMQVLGSSKTKPEVKEKMFVALYGKANDEILDLISSRAEKSANDIDGGFDKTNATGKSYTGKVGKTDASGQDTDTKKDDTEDKTPPMKQMIINPDTGREIKVQSALKYPRWKPVYKRAEKLLKNAGVDRKDRVKEPEVNARYKARAKKMKKEDLATYLGDTLSEQLLEQFVRDGVTLTVPGLGEVLLRLKSSVITEAAPQSHIDHPYDDTSMSFDDLHGLINDALVGQLSGATEKTDGQNLMFTIRDGQVVFARNTQQTKNYAANAMTSQEFEDFFSQHGDVVKSSFGAAAKDTERAIQQLPQDVKDKLFGNGKNFVMAEILNKDVSNTIPYNTNTIMFLSVREFDPNTGNPVNINPDAADDLGRLLAKTNANKQSTYTITGKNALQFDTTDENRKQAQMYNDELSSIQQKYGLSGTSTIGDYLSGLWSKLIDAQNTWTPEEKSALLNRFVEGDKSFGVRAIKDPAKKEKFYELEKSNKELNDTFIKPIKKIVLNVGADAIDRAQNLIGKNDGTKDKLKKKFIDAMKAIEKSNNPEFIDKLKTQLGYLNDVGIDKISPSEGMVFNRNGKLYKFTGAFAPVNQIVGIYTYKLNPLSRSGDTSTQPTDSTTKEKSSTQPVVVYPGRFQPFHAGHYSVYKSLVDKYGKDNVYIGTSDKTDNVKSPFNFNEKKSIMATMFDIPSDKIVQVKSPYAPTEIIDQYPESTPFITAFSQKDAERLGSGGKYYKPLPSDDSSLGNHKDNGYFTIVPEFKMDVEGDNISGTTVRNVLGDPNRDPEDKKRIFTAMYGKFNPQIFELITSKIATLSSEPKSDKPTPKKSAKPAKTSTEDPTKGVDPSVLGKKVRNPETDNDILVKTALGYDKQHPAYKTAKKLVNNESVIVEGGNAVVANSKIPNKFAQPTVANMANKLGLGKLNRALVGSTFKPIMNDLDVAMDFEDVKQAIGYTGTDKKEFFNHLKSYLDNTGFEVSVQPGFQQFSIAAPLVDETGNPQTAVDDSGKSTGEQGNVQVDFMMGDLPFMKRLLTNGDTSAVSSTYRNTMFADILSNIAEETETPGVLQRYLINSRDGIYKETFTKKSNGKRETITKEKASGDVEFLAKVLFGDNAKFSDIDTFEKLAKRVVQPDVKFRDKLPAIIDQFKNSITKMKKELPAGIPDTNDPADIKDNKPLRVYLDDLRPMPSDFDVNPKTAQEAIDLLKTGRVEFISFDHDLGPEEAGTGYDVARWIEEQGYTNDDFVVPQWQLHSANPVGRKNIERAMQSAERSPGGNRIKNNNNTKQKSPTQDDLVDKVNPELLNKKIRNPETDNDILVKTALGYDKNHPAYKSAEKVVRNNKK